MIKASKITTKVNGIPKLNEASLFVKEGDFCVLFGDDGVGKTSLLHIILGFNVSFNGQVTIFDKKPNYIGKEDREKVRFVPDDIVWERRLTGEQYLQNLSEMTSGYSKALQDAMCSRFEIELKQKVMEMSEEENKLLQIIGAVCAGPRLLILDEPLNYLNDDKYHEMLKALAKFNRSGMTILLVVKEAEDACGYGKRYACMSGGKIISTGAMPRTIEQAKKVTVTKDGVDKPYIYKGDVSKIGSILKRAGFDDWTIENITFREELELIDAEKKQMDSAIAKA